MTTLGEDQYVALFQKCGELEDYCIPDAITLNGASIEITDLTSIATALSQDDSSTVSVEVE